MNYLYVKICLKAMLLYFMLGLAIQKLEDCIGISDHYPEICRTLKTGTVWTISNLYCRHLLSSAEHS